MQEKGMSIKIKFFGWMIVFWDMSFAVEVCNAFSQILIPLSQYFVVASRAHPSTPALCVNAASWVHLIPSFSYHMHVAFGKVQDRVYNPHRRLDQTFIHVTCIAYGWALSCSTRYAVLLLIPYHFVCIALLWMEIERYRVLRIVLGILSHSCPLLVHGNANAFLLIWFFTAVGGAFFFMGGWGHTMFHIAMAPAGVVIQLEACRCVDPA